MMSSTANIGRAEDLWVALEGVIEGDLLRRFETFMAANPTKGWIIGSDYVIDDKARPHDCFCFTVYPIDEHAPLKHWQEVAAAIPRDLKNTRRIDDSIVSCLQDQRRFSFCFVVTKERNPDVDLEMAKAAIDGNLAIMHRWQNAAQRSDLIRRMQRLRQEAGDRAKVGDQVERSDPVAFSAELPITVRYLLNPPRSVLGIELCEGVRGQC
jgi:hypothetical protein